MKALRNVFLAVVGLLAVAGTAQAATDLGTLSPTSGPLWSGLVDHTSSFSDDYTFNVSSGPLDVLAGGVFFNWGGTFSKLDLTYGASTFDLLSTGSGNSVSLGTLATGSYKFTVSGAPSSSSAYYGVQVSAVPLPAAAWLFGTGLIGLVGIARRRS